MCTDKVLRKIVSSENLRAYDHLTFWMAFFPSILFLGDLISLALENCAGVTYLPHSLF